MNNPVRAYERSEWRSAGYRHHPCAIVWKTGFFIDIRTEDTYIRVRCTGRISARCNNEYFLFTSVFYPAQVFIPPDTKSPRSVVYSASRAFLWRCVVWAYITTLCVVPSTCTRYMPCDNSIWLAFSTVVWCSNIPHKE